MSTQNTPTQPTPNQHLDSDVRSRLTRLGKQTCLNWGGDWINGTPTVSTTSLTQSYTDKTVVRSAQDGRDAFEKYTEWFDHIVQNTTPTADRAVLLPCGASKPIGTSQIHQKKLSALANAGYLDNTDVWILSEPCTIIPHTRRLSLPAVNYDFPPKYAEESTAPTVFDVFTSRLADWIDNMAYDVFDAYLVQRHQQKLDAALEKATTAPTVVQIPGASANLTTLQTTGDAAYSGDLFKSVEDITAKLQFVKQYCDPTTDTTIEHYSDAARAFYRDRYGTR